MIQDESIPDHRTSDSGESSQEANLGIVTPQTPPKVQEPSDNHPKTKRQQKPTLPIRLWRIHRKRQRGIPPANRAEKLTVGITLVIAVIAAVQAVIYHQQKGIMESSGRQTDKLIAAANIQAGAAEKIATASDRNAAAAERFAVSAKEQSKAQRNSASSEKESAQLIRESLHVSERAYLVVGAPIVNEEIAIASAPVDNVGRIPTGTVDVVTHEITVKANATGQIFEGDVIENHGSKMHVDSVTPNPARTRSTIDIVLPAFSKEAYDSGTHQIIAAGTISYQDGFKDDPIQNLEWCYDTSYSPAMKHQIWTSCPNTLDMIQRLEKRDGYRSR